MNDTPLRFAVLPAARSVFAEFDAAKVQIGGCWYNMARLGYFKRFALCIKLFFGGTIKDLTFTFDGRTIRNAANDIKNAINQKYGRDVCDSI